jgi:pyrroline-5-carboxylate reductase
MSIAIIGAGNMGLAMWRRLSVALGPENVWVCDPHEEKLKSVDLSQAATNLLTILPKVDTVILAIKPQSFIHWNQDLSNHLILSIMTGITLKTLSEKSGSKKVVRSMPNLALQLGCSLTGWIASQEVNTKEKQLIHTIFSHFGKEFEVEKESDLDSLTALSGSGPAYFLYFCSELTKKAEEFGFPYDQAREIVTETLKGASELLQRSEGHAQQLIKAITSQGGTTQAFLNTLNEGLVDHVFSKAVDAALSRAKELSK